MRAFFAVLMMTGLLASSNLSALDSVGALQGPIHEAYVAQSGGTLVLEAVSTEPPADLQETPPKGCEEGVDWIPGYWAWSETGNTFVWVPGIWRQPPPQHQWIKGQWQQTDDGWVWLHGFWSTAPENDLNYVQTAPPEPLVEQAGDPSEDNMFWMPGYWGYSEGDRIFQWYQGAWEKSDPNWVFVPVQWLWRPAGYLFVPSYWDYPIDQRGCVYAPVPYDQASASEEAPQALSQDDVVEALFPDYPNYSVFFQQYYYANPGFWSRYPWAPAWWAWPIFWTYPWWDQWGLFWWWTHPGFPAPLWLTVNITSHIWPAPARLLGRMKGRRGPFIVTPTGVVRPSRLLSHAAELQHRNGSTMHPIIPAGGDLRGRINRAAGPGEGGARALHASGQPPGPGERRGAGPNAEITPSALPKGARPPQIPAKPRISGPAQKAAATREEGKPPSKPTEARQTAPATPQERREAPPPKPPAPSKNVEKVRAPTATEARRSAETERPSGSRGATRPSEQRVQQPIRRPAPTGPAPRRGAEGAPAPRGSGSAPAGPARGPASHPSAGASHAGDGGHPTGSSGHGRDGGHH